MTARPGQIVDFGEGREGFVVWARPPVYFCQLFVGSDGAVPAVIGETEVTLPQETPQNAVLRVAVGGAKLGRRFDYLDAPLDGKGALGDDAARVSLPVFNDEPEKGSTDSLTRGLHTGVVAADALTPIGRGQTMLVAGGQGVGRTELALYAVQHQALAAKASSSPVACVWACLRGQGAGVAAALEARGALGNTAVVEARADASPSERFATAAAALAVAEGFRNQGADSLVVIDDFR